MTKALVHGFVTLAFVLLPLTTLSQSMPEKVPAPLTQVGDSWTFRYTDNWTGKLGNSSKQEVVAVSDQEIAIDAKRPNGRVISHLRFSPGMNPINRGNMTFSPYYPRYSFPLEPGKVWKETVTGENKSLARTWRYEVTGSVVGWEKVKVPAGEFDALKVLVEAYYSGAEATGWRGNGHLTEAVWYVPSVRNFVKLDYQDTDWNGKIYNRDSWELTAFSAK